MFSAVLVLSVLAAPEPRVSAVIAELLRRDCPKLFDQPTPGFQADAPRESWPPFCAQLAEHGRLLSAAQVGTDSGFGLYRLTFERAERTLGLAFDKAGRISGLFSRPWVAETRTRLRWPLNKPTLVFWGGDSPQTNAHVRVPRQQRAVDLDVVGENGATKRDAGTRNEDFFTYGAEVLAAADGKVRAAVDGVPDNEPGRQDDTLVPGNVVSIEHGPGEFAHYCHLQRGSVRVKAGDGVKAGQVLGLAGNSGNSSEPHLHFHVQSSPLMAEGVGLQPVFHDVCLQVGADRKPAGPYRPRKGDVVVPCAAGKATPAP